MVRQELSEFYDEEGGHESTFRLQNSLEAKLKALQPRIKSLRHLHRTQIVNMTRSTVLQNWSAPREQSYGSMDMDPLARLAKVTEGVFEACLAIFLKNSRQLLEALQSCTRCSPWPTAQELVQLNKLCSSESIANILSLIEQPSDSSQGILVLMLQGLDQQQVVDTLKITAHEARNAVLVFWERVDIEIRYLEKLLRELGGISFESEGEFRQKAKSMARKVCLHTAMEIETLFNDALTLVPLISDPQDHPYLSGEVQSIKNLVMDQFTKDLVQIAKHLCHIQEACPELYQFFESTCS